MIPDYSFNLCFLNEKRNNVLSQFANLCDSKSGQALESKTLSDEKWDMEICLVAPFDVSNVRIQHYPKLPDGRTSIGIIDFTYTPITQHANAPGCFEIEIWPRTWPIQFIYFSSMEFRTKLVEMLRDCGGRLGLIQYESWFPIEFWSPEVGRHHDDRPNRTTDQLLCPSELAD